MTDPQKLQLRQQAANFLAAIASIIPSAKSGNLSLDLTAQQVNVQIQAVDASVPSGTAVEVQTIACKFADLPAAE